MQLNAVKESWGSENQKWLGSSHATDVAQTVTLDGAKFAAFAGKTIPSGIPLKKAESGGKFEPVADAGDALAGFLFTAQSWDGKGDVIAPMLDHGRIKVDFLPEDAFDVTSLSTPSPHFVLVKKEA